MEKIKSRPYSLPETLSAAIASVLSTRFRVDVWDSKKIAQAIQRMSDFYIANPSSQTPWREEWCQVAQLAYFLPLNFLRAQAVMDEAQRVGYLKQFSSYVDFGSGLGALTMALSKNYGEGGIVEISQEAIALYQMLSELQNLKPARLVDSNFRGKGVLRTFSYSLTEEVKHSDKELGGFEGLLIIEPSTQQDGRRLLELRQKLLDLGFYIWAPCTHQKACPLYTQSKKDWCHDRIHLSMPDWFMELEKYLPFKNRTITFSYLLASKVSSFEANNYNMSGETSGVARVVGDTLHEKGKSRLMICRGENREFISWLHKDMDRNYEVPRGVVLEVPEGAELKSNELRIRTPVKFINK